MPRFIRWDKHSREKHSRLHGDTRQVTAIDDLHEQPSALYHISKHGERHRVTETNYGTGKRPVFKYFCDECKKFIDAEVVRVGEMSSV